MAIFIFVLIQLVGIGGLAIAYDMGKASDIPSRFVARVLGYTSGYMTLFALIVLTALITTA